jgi:hypothetical protein
MTMAETKTAPATGAKANGKPRELPVIRLDTLKLREHAHNVYFVVAPQGMKVEDLTKPEVWSAVTHQLSLFDIIRVLVEEEGGNDQWVELIVRYAEIGRVCVRQLRVIDLGPKESETEMRLPPGHSISYDTSAGWIVRRDADGVILGKGSERGWGRREDAIRFLLEHATVRQSVPGRRFA